MHKGLGYRVMELQGSGLYGYGVTGCTRALGVEGLRF